MSGYVALSAYVVAEVCLSEPLASVNVRAVQADDRPVLVGDPNQFWRPLQDPGFRAHPVGLDFVV